MEHAVTIGDVLGLLSILGAIGLGLAAVVFVLWFMAQGWDH